MAQIKATYLNWHTHIAW